MRTLALLAALLLLAFQTRAQTLQETTDPVPTQDNPGEEDQDLFGDEDQDVAISFTGEERPTRQLIAPGTPNKTQRVIPKIITDLLIQFGISVATHRCHCRQQHECPYNKVNKILERASWACRPYGRQYKLCCK